MAGATGCAGLMSFSGNAFLMSEEQEAELGAKFKGELEKEIVYVREPVVTDYIEELGRRISRNSPSSPFEPKFYVIENDEINAFAIPGGSVFVHTGLIAAADDEAELAGVVAHEVGHVVRRHSARALSSQMTLDFAGDLFERVLLGEDSLPVFDALTGLTQQWAILKHSRVDESEADAIAVRSLHRAGYDPTALTAFFEKLVSKYGDRGPVATFFASHPATGSRINEVNAHVATLPPKDYERPITDLRRVQGRLRELGMAQ